MTLEAVHEEMEAGSWLCPHCYEDDHPDEVRSDAFSSHIVLAMSSAPCLQLNSILLACEMAKFKQRAMGRTHRRGLCRGGSATPPSA